MPAVSIAQQHLMQAAEHGADFPMANKLRDTMSHSQLHDFSVGSEAGKPEHVGVKGATPDVLHANTTSFKEAGLSEHEATKKAIRKSTHGNLGKFLHPRKDGKPHGS